MTSALVAMVTGWSKEASRRCAQPELDPDTLIGLGLSSLSSLSCSQRTFSTLARAEHSAQQWVEEPQPLPPRLGQVPLCAP